MGNLYSTMAEEARQYKEVAAEDERTPQPATPSVNNDENSARNHKILGLIDPRSPSQGVSRTPLEIEERNRRLEKARLNNLLLSKENNLDVIQPQDMDIDSVKTPTGPPKGSLLEAFDPRSPNAEIQRTPISYANNTPVGRKVFQN